MTEQGPDNIASDNADAEPAASGERLSGTVVRRGSVGWVGVLPLAVAMLLGVLGGLGAFTFAYGDGLSYLSDDPKACANCHVMQSFYDSWQASSHRHVATCNDCHLSDHPIGKWIVKADNGFFHSLAFTTGDFAEPIRIKPRNKVVTQNACIACHGDFVHQMLPIHPGGDMLSCVHCHSDAGHAHRR